MLVCRDQTCSWLQAAVLMVPQQVDIHACARKLLRRAAAAAAANTLHRWLDGSALRSPVRSGTSSAPTTHAALRHVRCAGTRHGRCITCPTLCGVLTLVWLLLLPLPASCTVAVRQIVEAVSPVRANLDACVIFPSMPAVMKLNKLGTFSMSQLGQSKSLIGDFIK